MGKMKTADYLNRDVYEVFVDFNGKKKIQLLGYYYHDESTLSESRIVEFSNCFVNIRSKDESNLDYRQEVYLEEEKCIWFVEDCSDEECMERLSNELEGVTILPIELVTEDTPCGCYVDCAV